MNPSTTHKGNDMRFTHDDRKNGFFHELRTEIRNDVDWVIHQRTCHTTGHAETEGRMCFGGQKALADMFAQVVSSILASALS